MKATKQTLGRKAFGKCNNMETQLAILKSLDKSCRQLALSDIGDIQWEQGQQIHSFVLRGERGDPGAWNDFLVLIRGDARLASGIGRLLRQLGIVSYSTSRDRDRVVVPPGTLPLTETQEAELLAALEAQRDEPDAPRGDSNPMAGDVMYVEWKPGLTGHARIGRVRKSGSGKTLYYRNYVLISLKGQGYKANYVDSESGMEFWVSNCRKDGNDTLYPGVIEIDPNAREEYWTKIRGLPENVHVTAFRSEGKYSKRRPG